MHGLGVRDNASLARGAHVPKLFFCWVSIFSVVVVDLSWRFVMWPSHDDDYVAAALRPSPLLEGSTASTNAQPAVKKSEFPKRVMYICVLLQGLWGVALWTKDLTCSEYILALQVCRNFLVPRVQASVKAVGSLCSLCPPQVLCASFRACYVLTVSTSLHSLCLAFMAAAVHCWNANLLNGCWRVNYFSNNAWTFFLWVGSLCVQSW